MRWEPALLPIGPARPLALPHCSQLIRPEYSANSSGINTSKMSLPVRPFGMNTCAESPHLRPVFTPKIVAKSSAMNTSTNSPVTHFRMNTYRQPKTATAFRMNTYAKMGEGVFAHVSSIDTPQFPGFAEPPSPPMSVFKDNLLLAHPGGAPRATSPPAPFCARMLP
jgi:hypothetical protein